MRVFGDPISTSVQRHYLHQTLAKGELTHAELYLFASLCQHHFVTVDVLVFVHAEGVVEVVAGHVRMDTDAPQMFRVSQTSQLNLLLKTIGER